MCFRKTLQFDKNLKKNKRQITIALLKLKKSSIIQLFILCLFCTPQWLIFIKRAEEYTLENVDSVFINWPTNAT